MEQLKRLIREIHRRSLWQVLAIYVAASWVVFEIVQTLTEGLGLPDWVPPLALVLLLIGLPICLATAFVQEGGPPVTVRDPTLVPLRQTEEDASREYSSQDAGLVEKILTWRKAMLGGLLAFALLGMATATYMTTRALGIGPFGSLIAAGVVEERERIVVADFENQTGDSLLGPAATEALRIGLSQSPVLRVAEPAYLADVLGRMEVDPGEALDRQLAREVAIREGLKVIVVGRIVSAGESYLVSVRLIEAEEGEVLGSFGEPIDDVSDLISAIDRLSEKIRERIGESLKTIRASQPLARVTTHSLEALEKYSQARDALWRQGDTPRGVALLEEATRIAPDFAAAHSTLASHLANMGGERARAVRARRRAYELADRLPDRERYGYIARYHSYVTGDYEKAMAAWRSLLDFDPEHQAALNNLGILHYRKREFERAGDYFRRAIESDSSIWVPYGNLIEVQVALGELQAAERTLEAKARSFEAHLTPYEIGVHINRRDYEAARAGAEAWKRDASDPRELYRGANRDLARLAALRGRIAEAEKYWSEAMALDQERDLPAEYLKDAVRLAGLQVWLEDAEDRGLATVDSALEFYPLDSIPPFDWPVVPAKPEDPIEPMLPAFYAFAGEPQRARAVLSAYEARVDPELRQLEESRLRGVHGLVAIAEGRYPQAIEGLRAWDEETPNMISVLPHLGRAYDLAGQPDSALAIYERYVRTPVLWRLDTDAFHLGWIYERLGALYEKRGNPEKAIYYYGKFADLWKDADPELQPRVEAARRAIAALSPDR